MKIIIQRFLCLIVILSVTGCASVISGRLQNVAIKTSPDVNASCMLANDKGRWDVSSTPVEIQINSSYQDLEIICKKEGYRDAKKSVVSSMKRVMFLSLFFGGVLVDGLNGAGFAYPKEISIEMHPDKSAYLMEAN